MGVGREGGGKREREGSRQSGSQTEIKGETETE